MSAQNLAAVGLGLLCGLGSFAILGIAAVAASYHVSKKHKAGIAGMSILLLFVFGALLVSLGVFVVVLVTNLRPG